MTIDIIATLRKKVTLHSILIITLIAVLMISSIVLPMPSSLHEDFLWGALIGFRLVLLFAVYLVFRRMAAYRDILKAGNENNAIENLEKWVNDEYTAYRSTDMIRLVLGAVVVIGMLLLIFFKPDTHLTGAVFMAFIGLVSLSMLKGWSLMRDGMNIQDMKHKQRDQASDMS